mgnify:FL=1
MIEFAVVPKDESVGRWVLAVDPVHDKLLITGEDSSLRWVLTADCKFLKAKNPELPLPVVVVQAPKDQIVVPHVQLGSGPNGRQH